MRKYYCNKQGNTILCYGQSLQIPSYLQLYIHIWNTISLLFHYSTYTTIRNFYCELWYVIAIYVPLYIDMIFTIIAVSYCCVYYSSWQACMVMSNCKHFKTSTLVFYSKTHLKINIFFTIRKISFCNNKCGICIFVWPLLYCIIKFHKDVWVPFLSLSPHENCGARNAAKSWLFWDLCFSGRINRNGMMADAKQTCKGFQLYANYFSFTVP